MHFAPPIILDFAATSVAATPGPAAPVETFEMLLARICPGGHSNTCCPEGFLIGVDFSLFQQPTYISFENENNSVWESVDHEFVFDYGTRMQYWGFVPNQETPKSSQPFFCLVMCLQQQVCYFQSAEAVPPFIFQTRSFHISTLPKAKEKIRHNNSLT